MDAKQINKEWGDKMLGSLTAQDAAVVFMLGLNKRGDVKIVVTTDLDPTKQKAALQRAVEILTIQIDKMSSPK